MIKRNSLAIWCLLVASALPMLGAMEVSICPALTVEHKGDQDALFRAYEDLFVERLNEWQFV
jgi:hypothetical protein